MAKNYKKMFFTMKIQKLRSIYQRKYQFLSF